MTYLLAFLVSALYIGLKATQQRQVQHAQYAKMPPVSLGMAYCEAFVFSSYIGSATEFWPKFILATAVGLGASCGSILGTYIHARKHPPRS